MSDDEDFEEIIKDSYVFAKPAETSDEDEYVYSDDGNFRVRKLDLSQMDWEDKEKQVVRNKTIDGIIVLLLFSLCVWLFTWAGLSWGWNETRVLLGSIIFGVLISFCLSIEEK